MQTKITNINIIPIRPNNGLIALASCILDEKIYLGSIGIYTKLKGGFRITYPSKKVRDNSIDLYYPIIAETGKAIEDAIIGEYEKLIV